MTTNTCTRCGHAEHGAFYLVCMTCGNGGGSECTPHVHDAPDGSLCFCLDGRHSAVGRSVSGSEVTIAVYREKAHPVHAVRFETNNDDGSHIATIVGWGNNVAPSYQHLWTDNTRIYLEDLHRGRRALDVGEWLLLHEDVRLSAVIAQIFEVEYEPMPSEVPS